MRLLTRDGWLAAAAVGAIVLGFGEWRAAVLLVTFFGTSSALTRWHAERKGHPEHLTGRSAAQVVANGAVATVLAVWLRFDPSVPILTAFASALAASTADTWATEVGMASMATPRLITTWQPVLPGTSGAITFVGTAAGVVGALLIAVLSTILLHTSIVAVMIAGAIAMMADSLLGAAAEGRILAIDNNAVNLLATMTGALLGAWFA